MISTRAITTIAVLLLTHPGNPRAEPGEGVAWVGDSREALDTARRDGRPLLLDFSTTWCPACRRMEERFWPDPEVVELTRKFVCVKIDGDRFPGLVARYRVNAFPTTLFLDPWGEEMTRMVGFDHDDALVLLAGLPGDFSSVLAARAQVDHDRRALRPLLDLGRFYGEHELYQISNDYYRKAIKTREAKGDRRIMADLMTAIGWNYIEIGEHRKARKSFERRLEDPLEPSGLDRALYGLVSVSLSLGEGEEARRAFERLCTECPSSELVDRARSDLDAAGP